MPTSSESDVVPLELYLAYEFLTVEQHSRILGSINGIYETLLGSAEPYWFWRYGPPFLRLSRSFKAASALCTSSAETGESIKFKFQVKKRWPEVVYDGDDLDVFLPAWTAVAFAVGAAATFGMSRWEQYVNIQKTGAEARKANLEADRMEEELRRMRLLGPHAEEDKFTAAELNLHVNCFQTTVAAPNITNVLVNGIPVKPEVRGLTSR